MAVRFVSSNITSALGFSTEENFQNLLQAKVGITSIENQALYPTPFMAACVDDTGIEERFKHLNSKQISATRLEKMMIVSIHNALSLAHIDISSPRTLIILSTTKGNIDLLNPQPDIDPDRVLLWKMGEFIGQHFSNPNPVRVISNACISGVLAINTAAMILQGNEYDHAVVVGGDLVTRFVVSGFMSFLSLSPTPCKPFDLNRDGLSLGEAAGTIILEKTDTHQKGDLLFKGGATANDANHISGPSRTGEGSFIAMQKAFEEAGISTQEIDHINAHGTATRYNDDMESMAIQRHQLSRVPVNSFKGSWGHTLGAAGIIETAALLESMKKNMVLPTAGFQVPGTTEKLEVSNQPVPKDLNTCLKLASGFGGCNGALIIQKI
jgi:3-oxoacyl-[acyl-carrier-protein] synthase-1